MTDETDTPDDDREDFSPGIVRYRVNDDVNAPFFEHPEEAEEIEDGIYTCPQQPVLEKADQHGVITVLDWNWDGEGDPTYQTLDAPPELLAREDDDTDNTQLVVAAATADGSSVSTIDFSSWMCVRCGTITETFPVYEGDDELPTPEECSGCERQGPFEPAGVPRGSDPQEILDTLLLNPPWSPPPGFRDDLETLRMGDLFDRVRDHISTHWKSGGRSWLYDGLAAYALSSWFRPAFDFVPHLLVFGPKETGKSRLYNTLSEVCYRARHIVSSSPAFLYRSVSEFNISLFVSEFHRMEEETRKNAEAIINAGQKRGEAIGRTEEAGGSFDPVVFDPFTHFGISSQREPADDLLSRCFVIQGKQATGEVPRVVQERDDLQRDLLTARFRYLHSEELDDAIEETRRRMDEDRLYGRLSEKLYALVAMANLCDRDIDEFVAHVTESDRELESDSIDAIVTQSIIDVALDMIAEGKQETFGDDGPWASLKIPYDRVIEQLMEMTGEEMSPQRFGNIRARLGLNKVRTSDGTFIRDEELLPKLQQLSEQYHLDMPIEEAEESQKQRLDRVYDAICNHANEDGPANIQEVLDHLDKENLDEDAVTHDIQKLLEEGKVYRQDGGIRPT